jgi:hypothetical protein
LESLFAFSNLAELAVLLRVSKLWATAVQTMRPLSVEFRSNGTVEFLCASRISRHIDNLYQYPPLPVQKLSLLSSALRHLRVLRCTFKDEWSPRSFPTGLRELYLQFDYPQHDPLAGQQPRHLDATIVAIAALPLLETLTLAAYDAISCCLTPLATAPALRNLTLVLAANVLQSVAAVDALRNMSHLRSLNFNPSPSAFVRMLEMPHSMKLTTLHVALFTAECGEAVVQLPTLTDLSISLSAEHTDFLRRLPNLRSLSLNGGLSDVAFDADRIMASLHSLAGLTALHLSGGGDMPLQYTSDHFVACLPRLPLLSALSLTWASGMDSLRFLSSGPITRSLKHLSLQYFEKRLPLAELSHVHALSTLTNLTLCCVFDASLDESLYTPPSSLMPSLHHFAHTWKPVGQEDDFAWYEPDEEEQAEPGVAEQPEADE